VEVRRVRAEALSLTDGGLRAVYRTLELVIALLPVRIAVLMGPAVMQVLPRTRVTVAHRPQPRQPSEITIDEGNARKTFLRTTFGG
jgi:hypothetical protein